MAKVTTTEDLDRVRDALAQGINVRDAAKHVGLSKDAIYRARDRGAIDLTPPPRVSAETYERMIAAIADGMTLVNAARHVGISKHAAYQARDLGLLDLSSVPKGYTGGSKGKVFGVPAWAKKLGLAEDYRDLARVLGEDYAARVCRQLSAEARA